MIPNKIILKHKFEALEVLTPIETRNQYSVTDDKNNILFLGKETSNIASTFLLKSHRPIEIGFTDLNGGFLFKIQRPFRLIRSNYKIFNKRNEIVGFIQQVNYFFGSHFQLLNANKNLVCELKYQPFDSKQSFTKLGFPIEIKKENALYAKVDIAQGYENIKFAVGDAVDLIIDFNVNEEDIKILILALVLSYSLFFERK
tara:strand:- start:760 stop:1359 length:600 start_codon:yes stop_codon:yes gene_type:complete